MDSELVFLIIVCILITAVVAVGYHFLLTVGWFLAIVLAIITVVLGVVFINFDWN